MSDDIYDLDFLDRRTAQQRREDKAAMAELDWLEAFEKDLEDMRYNEVAAGYRDRDGNPLPGWEPRPLRNTYGSGNGDLEDRAMMRKRKRIELDYWGKHSDEWPHPKASNHVNYRRKLPHAAEDEYGTGRRIRLDASRSTPGGAPMKLGRREPAVSLDADGNPIDPDTVYAAIEAYATGEPGRGEWVVRRGERQRGDHYKVLHNAGLWLPADTAGDAEMADARFRMFGLSAR